MVNTMWTCFVVLSEKFKEIKEWIRVKFGKNKIVPESKSFAQILAWTRRVPDQVLVTTGGDPILGKLKSHNRMP